MRVKCFWDASIFSLAFVFLAECKDLSGCIVVELEQLAVWSQGVENVLADVEEEHGSWLNSVFFFKLVKACVRKEYQLIWRRFLLTHSSYSCLLSRLLCVIVTEELHQLLLSILFLKIHKDLLAFVSEIRENLLEQVHWLVLAQVSEVSDIFFQMEGCEILSTDINHQYHEFLQNNHVWLGFPVLKANMEHAQGFLPVLVKFIELFGSFQAGLRGCVSTKRGCNLLGCWLNSCGCDSSHKTLFFN